MSVIKKIKNISELLASQESYIKSNSEEVINFDAISEFNPWKFKLGSDSSDEYSENIWNENLYSSIENLENIILNNRLNNKKMEVVDNNDRFSKLKKYTLFLLDIDKLSKHDKNMIMSSFSSNHFTIELIGKNEKKLSDLSFGEQQLLFILNQLYALGVQNDIDVSDEAIEHNERINEENLDEEYINEMSIPLNHYIVLLDEIDIGFHPEWGTVINSVSTPNLS